MKSSDHVAGEVKGHEVMPCVWRETYITHRNTKLDLSQGWYKEMSALSRGFDPATHYILDSCSTPYESHN